MTSRSDLRRYDESLNKPRTSSPQARGDFHLAFAPSDWIWIWTWTWTWTGGYGFALLCTAGVGCHSHITTGRSVWAVTLLGTLERRGHPYRICTGGTGTATPTTFYGTEQAFWFSRGS
ncbi:hypothetical protein K431DRAFT_285855 [Polychaeton citri CBS 116435]|uniref:Uncharacterized protein n=1 Tax=Polychaeton citri CBS 116435 TaxID=1314669 RepID=A0A9P4Q6E4_9PEZI|nr:hypothetical protein K431DRAFT_285855 [Polychaeton citri CBS 116435]